MLPIPHSGPLPKLTPTAPTSALIADTDRRAQMNESLNPILPSELVGLIAEYDMPLASQPLRVDDRGNLIESDENRAIRSAIRDALISQDIDPKIKRQIFINAMQFQYRREFHMLLSELRNLCIPVNLNNTDLSCLFLKGFYLGQATAVSINLSGSIIEDCSFAQANLTNANLKGTSFKNVDLFKASLYGATFEKTRFVYCAAGNLITNDMSIDQLACLDRTIVFIHGTHTTKPSHLEDRAHQLTVLPTNISPCVIS
jgi:hypothetical protein